MRTLSFSSASATVRSATSSSPARPRVKPTNAPSIALGKRSPKKQPGSSAAPAYVAAESAAGESTVESGRFCSILRPIFVPNWRSTTRMLGLSMRARSATERLRSSSPESVRIVIAPATPASSNESSLSASCGVTAAPARRKASCRSELIGETTRTRVPPAAANSTQTRSANTSSPTIRIAGSRACPSVTVPPSSPGAFDV